MAKKALPIPGATPNPSAPATVVPTRTPVAAPTPAPAASPTPAKGKRAVANAEVSVSTESLIASLAAATNPNDKKKIRRQLRRAGHFGGLRKREVDVNRANNALPKA